MSGDEDFETADEDHGLRFTENTRVPRRPEASLASLATLFFPNVPLSRHGIDRHAHLGQAANRGAKTPRRPDSH